MDIKWEEPPAPEPGSGRHNPEEDDFVLALRERPREWARFMDFQDRQRASTLAGNIRSGARKSFADPQGGRFIAVARKPDTEQPESTLYAVYVRFVPEAEATAHRG